MKLSRTPRTLAIWIAITVTLLAGLMPAWSGMFSGGATSAWTEVCTLQGSKWVLQTDASLPADDDSGKATGLQHCPFCTSHAQVLGLPASGWVWTRPLDLRESVLLPAEDTPRGTYAWLSARPRAPPAFA